VSVVYSIAHVAMGVKHELSTVDFWCVIVQYDAISSRSNGRDTMGLIACCTFDTWTPKGVFVCLAVPYLPYHFEVGHEVGHEKIWRSIWPEMAVPYLPYLYIYIYIYYISI
jgi:hypothetical protein